MDTMGKTKEEKGDQNDSPQKSFDSAQNKREKSKVFILFVCSQRNYHLAIIFFCVLTGFLIWELFSYYRRCSSNQNWAGTTHTSLLQPICSRWGNQLFWATIQYWCFFIFFFFSLKLQSSDTECFIHDTLKMWIKLNFRGWNVHSLCKMSVWHSCISTVK